jgi:LmbE family N-acetylglucosaminyl deacetylase
VTGKTLEEATVQQQQIRALMIGAHPDDCEFKTGGLATRLRAAGHVVKFVSATNGEAGHHLMGGGPLAQRRAEEARRVAEGPGSSTTSSTSLTAAWKRTSPHASASSA